MRYYSPWYGIISCSSRRVGGIYRMICARYARYYRGILTISPWKGHSRAVDTNSALTGFMRT